jgi:hypothetical protein
MIDNPLVRVILTIAAGLLALGAGWCLRTQFGSLRLLIDRLRGL